MREPLLSPQYKHPQVFRSPRNPAQPLNTHLKAQTILEVCREGILFLDTEGRVQACNASAERILGLNESRLLGLGSVDPEVFNAVDENLNPIPMDLHPSRIALRTGKPCLDVVQGLPKGKGEFMWIKVNAMPLFGAEGGPIEGVVISFADITEMKNLESSLRQEASHDELTGLYNRRYFIQALTRAVHSASRYTHPLSLCFCDLDHLKAINDTFGHAVGDQAICFFSEHLLLGLRQADLVARLGGDEFCILFAHTPAEGASIFLERIRTLVEDSPLRVNGETVISLSASFGIANFDPTMTPEMFMSAADQALYLAKTEGRDRVRIL